MASTDGLIDPYTFPLIDLNWIMRNGVAGQLSDERKVLSARFHRNRKLH
jgi:hypothetical protein